MQLLCCFLLFKIKPSYRLQNFGGLSPHRNIQGLSRNSDNTVPTSTCLHGSLVAVQLVKNIVRSKFYRNCSVISCDDDV